MIDVIIVTVIAIAAFFILRGQIRKFRRGQCSCGCGGCSDNCGSCAGAEMKNAGK